MMSAVSCAKLGGGSAPCVTTDFRSDFSACGGAAYCWGAGAGAPPSQPSPTPPQTRRPPSSRSRVSGFVHLTRSGHHDRCCQRNQAYDLKRLRASSAYERAEPVPLLQDVTRGHPPRRDDVGPISAVAAAGRRPAFRAGESTSPCNPLQLQRWLLLVPVRA